MTSSIPKLREDQYEPVKRDNPLPEYARGGLNFLTGSGIELGALHRPCIVPNVEVQYVDRLPYEELCLQYPELDPRLIVAPTILDDAEVLGTVSDSSQDFVIANQVIEHMRDPLSTLENWIRVLKCGGILFLAAPDRDFSFDHNRPLTQFSHLVRDSELPKDSDEAKKRDFEHFKEFALEVSCKTFSACKKGEVLQFAQQLWERNYSIHFHVWNSKSFFEFVDEFCRRYNSRGFLKDKIRVVLKAPSEGDVCVVVLKKSTAVRRFWDGVVYYSNVRRIGRAVYYRGLLPVGRFLRIGRIRE